MERSQHQYDRFNSIIQQEMEGLIDQRLRLEEELSQMDYGHTHQNIKKMDLENQIFRLEQRIDRIRFDMKLDLPEPPPGPTPVRTKPTK